MKKTLALALVAYFSLFILVLAGCSSSDIANDKLRIAINWKKQGDMNEYKSLVKEAYQTDPNNPYVLNAMGTVAEEDGKYKEAAGFYEKAMASAGDARVAVSDVKGDQGMLLKDLAAQNLKNVQSKVK